MSLREELWTIGYQHKESNPIFKAYEQKDMDAIINKVLDAVETNIEGIRISELSLQMGINAECQEIYCDAFLELIQRLKGES